MRVADAQCQLGFKKLKHELLIVCILVFLLFKMHECDKVKFESYSVLSGLLGRENALARLLGDLLGGPIITLLLKSLVCLTLVGVEFARLLTAWIIFA